MSDVFVFMKEQEILGVFYTYNHAMEAMDLLSNIYEGASFSVVKTRFFDSFETYQTIWEQ